MLPEEAAISQTPLSELKLMSEITALQTRREGPFFPQWAEFVEPQLVTAAEDCIRRLIDRLVSIGATLTRDQVQTEIDVCLREFNDLDASKPDSWIMTIEREDISEVLWGIIELCGCNADEEWLGERDW